MSRYRKNYSADENDTDETNPNPEGGDPTSTSNEETTWQKRHGDLRRHSQQREQELQDKIRELEEAASKATPEIKLPKTKDEVQAFMRKFPDIGGVIETIAHEKAIEMSKNLEGKLGRVKELEDKLREKDLDAAKERAWNELIAAHPDFDTLRTDKRFQDWIGNQDKWVQDALWNNETNSRAAIDAIRLYKADNKSTRPSNRGTDSVRSPRAAPTGGSDTIYSESMLQRMSDDEYEKQEAKIELAIREGRFKYDLTQAA